MVKTIGGEFGLDPALLKATDNGLAGTGHYFSSGRAAFHAILKHLKREYPDLLVLLPSYLCYSVIQPLDDLDLPFDFYRLTSDLHVDQEDANKIAQREPARKLVFLVINYFGLIDSDKDVAFIKDLDAGHIVVQDNVQAFFDMGSESRADFCFTSFRKTLPMPDGGLVKTKKSFSPTNVGEVNAFTFYKSLGGLIKHQASDNDVDDEVYMRFFKLGEEELDRNKFYDANISELSLQILHNLDLQAIADRRAINFRHLRDRLLSIGIRPIIDMKRGKVPLFFPILIKDRDNVRRALAQARIFCPAHWPLPAKQRERLGSSTVLYENELSIVIDQRYGPEDMETIAAKLEALNVEVFIH